MKLIDLQLIGGTDARLRTTLGEERLPTEDLMDENVHLFAVMASGERVGYAGYQPCDEHHVLVRSLVVLPAHRGQGYGSTVIKELMQRFAALDLGHAWLLTNDQQPFFEKNLFAQAAREAAPHSVRNTREFHDLCPETATLMFRGV